MIAPIAPLLAQNSAAPSLAQNSVGPAPAAVTDSDDPQAPIIPDSEFDEAVPALDPELNRALETLDAFEARQRAEAAAAAEVQAQQAEQSRLGNGAATAATSPALADDDPVEAIADAPVLDPEIDAPLPALATFDAEPPPAPTEEESEEATEIRYGWRIEGLELVDAAEDGISVEDRFADLSALEDGDGEAANGAQVNARMNEDLSLATRLLISEGYYDASARGSLVPPVERDPLTAVVTVAPGQRYTLGSIDLRSGPVLPPTLITENFALKTGDTIIADRVLAAEANLALVLPQQGYAFARLGQRDILLDPAAGTGAYTLPIDTGPRGRFGAIETTGDLAFDADHIGVLARFEPGELYDSRKVDDLRKALVATGLFATVSVEPQPGGNPAADGTEAVTLAVRQEAGPARTLAGSAGYGTGQGFRLEGSWTHRNLFPPEGALIASGVAGTQEQGLGLSFRRSNAGRRDRTVELGAEALRADYDAFEAFTGRLYGRISYDSTPIWQKRFTYSLGAELVGTNEDDYDFVAGERRRRTFGIVALPLRAGFDTSDDLLNPTRGFRINLSLSPEASVGSGFQSYARAFVDATGYAPFGDSFVLAGRARAGSIQGIDRGELAPSRRFYGGGGGSVRGFGYQQLGPRDPDNDPIGGRSFNEAAIEGRYRFGNFGVVAFVDAGQVYESSLPKFADWRFGLGVGGRFYTNFGPFRLDVATPLNRRDGESVVAVYVSIGQAF